MRGSLLAAAAMLALAGLAPAQRETAHEWTGQRDALQAGTAAWFEAELERIEALLEFDNEAARSGALELARLAGEHGESGVQVVAE
ncbi:MAG: hypothetical protein ABL998_22805, partial [Planctomycetota bacterium]